jgi:hypothetical protein
MHRKLRIAILPFILVSVAHTAWVARGRTAEWKYSVRVAIYPIAGDNSAASAAYIQQLRVETIQPIAVFMKAEAQRHDIVTQSRMPIRYCPSARRRSWRGGYRFRRPRRRFR